MPHKLKCPVCGKRIFDISDFPEKEFVISCKCPNCKEIVDVPCDKQHELTKKNIPSKRTAV